MCVCVFVWHEFCRKCNGKKLSTQFLETLQSITFRHKLMFTKFWGNWINKLRCCFTSLRLFGIDSLGFYCIETGNKIPILWNGIDKYCMYSLEQATIMKFSQFSWCSDLDFYCMQFPPPQKKIYAVIIMYRVFQNSWAKI